MGPLGLASAGLAVVLASPSITAGGAVAQDLMRNRPRGAGGPKLGVEPARPYPAQIVLAISAPLPGYRHH
jgi:hypothetical protein